MAKLATKAQKTNKKSSKLKFANVTGRKKVMLITLFAFVAIGAGVIIRSFAATNTWYYSISAKNLSGYSGVNCKNNQVTDVQKNSVPIHHFVCTRAGYTEAYILGNYFSTSNWMNQNFRICANIRGTGVVHVQIKIDGQADSLKGTDHIVGTNTYLYYCSPYLTLKKPAYIDGSVIGGYGVADYYVSSMTLEMQAATTPSTPGK